MRQGIPLLAPGSNPDSSVSPLRDETTMACWSRYAHAAQNRPHSRQPPAPATVGGSRDGGRMCLQLPLRVICSVTGTAGGTGRPALPGPSVGIPQTRAKGWPVTQLLGESYMISVHHLDPDRNRDSGLRCARMTRWSQNLRSSHFMNSVLAGKGLGSQRLVRGHLSSALHSF